MPEWSFEELARMIDHMLLHPMLDDKELICGMAFAVECNCASVCIKPCFVETAAKLLDGTGIKTGTVVGFPHGSVSTALKINEAKRAVDSGAEEIDMVINIGKVRSGEWGFVRDEIAGVNACVSARGAQLKVTFETGFLCDAMIEQLCGVCNEISPAYIKTSTGFGFEKQESGEYVCTGATVPHLALMRRLARPEIQVEAAGTIDTLDALLAARKLGAARIATSDTEPILREALRRLEE